jgi:hypothetical protein
MIIPKPVVTADFKNARLFIRLPLLSFTRFPELCSRTSRAPQQGPGALRPGSMIGPYDAPDAENSQPPFALRSTWPAQDRCRAVPTAAPPPKGARGLTERPRRYFFWNSHLRDSLNASDQVYLPPYSFCRPLGLNDA